MIETVLEIILQRQRSRRYNGTDHFKYRVTIPARIVATLGLVGGERLDVSVIRNTIVIRIIS